MNAIVRVGLGYDLHRLVKDRELILAQVPIDYDLGSEGHSDGDVVIHALIDALLGAAGLADIGEQFPDTDPAYKDIKSSALLLRTLDMISQAGFVPINIDATVIIEKPKLSDYKKLMKQKLAEMLQLPPDAVAIKAKTNEALGPIGTGQAVACLAVATLGKK